MIGELDTEFPFGNCYLSSLSRPAPVDMFSRILCLVGCLNSPFCNLAAAIVEIAAAIVENELQSQDVACFDRDRVAVALNCEGRHALPVVHSFLLFCADF